MGLVSFYYELWKFCVTMAENSYDLPFSPQVTKIHLSRRDSTSVDECSVSLTVNCMTVFPCYLVMY